MATWLGSALHLRTRASRRLAGAAGMTLLLCGVAWAASSSALAARGGIAILGGPEAGSEAGELDHPQDVAINQTGAGGVAAGTVYVADERNDRIDQFSPGGAFVRAFGLNVGGAGVDVCAATCVAGATGGAAGAMSDPQGVAVDQSDGSVYVADQGERRVDKFTAAGNFVWAAGWNVDGTTAGTKFEVCTAASGDACGRGAGGGNAGEFSSRIGGIAVNPTNGQVLIADPTNRRIQRLGADGSFLGAFGWDVIPAGKPGDTGVGLESCPPAAASSSGACRAGKTTEGGENPGQFARNQPTRLAADSGGSIYAVESTGNDRVQKFTPTGSAASVFAASALSDEQAPTQVAVDRSNDHVYIAKGTAGVLEFDNSGNLLGTQGSDLPEASGLAVDAATKDVYYSASAASQVIALGETVAPAVAIDPGSGFAVTPTSATLTGAVDPTGTTTVWHFEYVTEASFEQSGFEGAVLDPAGGETLPFTDETAHPVSQTVEGLLPSTTYRVRLAAAKPYGGDGETSTETTFTTTGAPPAVEGVGVNEVQNTSADLVGYVDPNGQPTSYRFEYGTAGPCASNPCTSVPLGGEAIGSGSSLLFVAQPVVGLSPRTEYHFRLVATNGTGAKASEDDTFTTRAAPLPANARGYELVSPAEKPGGQGVGGYSALGEAANAVPGTASTDGERYVSESLIGNITPGKAIYTSDAALSERVNGRIGWLSHSPYTHPNYSSTGGALTNLVLGAASADLSVFAASGGPPYFPALFPEMAAWPPAGYSLYATDWAGRWELVTPREPAYISTQSSSALLSPDGRHLVLQTPVPGQLGQSDPSLDQDANTHTLYDDDLTAGISDRFTPNGALSQVAVCTGEGSDRTEIPTVEAGDLVASPCPAAPAGREAALVSSGGADLPPTGLTTGTRNAVSDDGSRIFFQSPDTQRRRPKPPSSCSGEGAATSCPPELYLRQLDAAGEPTVRWLSRPEVPDQAAGLTGPSIFEGASTTGSRVFFRTDSPLTADDPNGGAQVPGGVKTGTADSNSWDLYVREVPSGASGHPDGEDPGGGSLTRVSAGPSGDGDCDVSNDGASGALRFTSNDGERLYFVCAGVLDGVPTNADPTDGTITTASGTPATTTTSNLYYYDATKPLPDRWEFVARLPRTATEIDGCSTVAEGQGEVRLFPNAGRSLTAAKSSNCFRGTADGRFVTFMTSGRLVAGDPEPDSVDVYAFDAESDKLIRIDAPQGGRGETYGCEGPAADPTGFCHADMGMVGSFIRPLPGVATEPVASDDHVAFFESKGQLVPGDTNHQYDVYEWRNGKLSLVSTGTDDHGAFYAGNGVDGRDVFFETEGQLTWQDVDGVMDVYDARVGGGISEPESGVPACRVLASQCQAPPTGVPAGASAASSGFVGSSNQATPAPRKNPYAGASKRSHHRKHRKHRRHTRRAHKREQHKKRHREKRRPRSRHVGRDRRAGR